MKDMNKFIIPCLVDSCHDSCHRARLSALCSHREQSSSISALPRTHQNESSRSNPADKSSLRTDQSAKAPLFKECQSSGSYSLREAPPVSRGQSTYCTPYSSHPSKLSQLNESPAYSSNRVLPVAPHPQAPHQLRQNPRSSVPQSCPIRKPV